MIALENLTEEFIQYLKNCGWKESGSLGSGRIRLFIKDDVEDSILVPLDSKFSDYHRIIKDSLKVLSSSESISLTKLQMRFKDLYSIKSSELPRIEQIRKEALKWKTDDDDFIAQTAFEAGALWADEHPIK